MVQRKRTADNADEFEEAWNDHIKTLYALQNSLPEEDLQDFEKTVEELEKFVEKASEHSFKTQD